MRKYILVLALLLCGGLSLAAQSRPPEATIFIKPVTGNGSKNDDNTFFYKQLIQEIVSQDFILANTQKGANFTLIGSLARYALSDRHYAFHLELRDNKTGELKVEGSLLYESQEDAKQQLPFLVSSLLFTIPADIIVEDVEINPDWRDKSLYLGLSAKWTPGFYTGGSQAKIPAGIQGGLSAEFHFSSFISVETGVEVQFDGVRATVNKQTKDYYGIIIGVPLLLKLCLKPGENSMIEPYVGPYFNILQIGNLKPYFLSIETGLQYSIKAGPGALFFDAGAAMDMGKSTVQKVPYSRINVHVGLGYKIGFMQREIQ
jgi:hypothetical protein